jgi:hypothetical protein
VLLSFVLLQRNDPTLIAQKTRDQNGAPGFGPPGRELRLAFGYTVEEIEEFRE